MRDEQWPVARLIPISSASGIEAQERRAASALLAVLAHVEEFGRALLRPLGAPGRGRIESFVEVPFKLDGRSIRPDGLIVVTHGAKTWTAVIETKTGPNHLDPQQIEIYLDLARHLAFDAVISISNQYVTSSSPYPIDIDKRKTKNIALHHWSWVDLLTEAVVQQEHRGIDDPDQAYILGELIRYLSDPRSGAASFNDMGPGWTAVRDGARQNTLRKTAPEVIDVASRWDDLMRIAALELTKDLGRDVSQVLAKNERTPEERQQLLRESMASSGRLYAQFSVPNVAGLWDVVADLRSRQVTVAIRIDAPKEGRSKGRVSWLLRQLQKAPDTLNVEVKVSRSTTSLASSLAAARETPELLYPEAGKDVRQFVVSLTRNMGLKRSAGQGSFIDSVLDTMTDFYGDVLQNLRVWKAAPAKLKKPTEEVPELKEILKALPEEVEEAVEEARAELGAGKPVADNGAAPTPTVLSSPGATT